MNLFNIWNWVNLTVVVGVPVLLIFLIVKILRRHQKLENKLHNLRIKKEKINLEKNIICGKGFNEFVTRNLHTLIALALLQTLRDLEKINQLIENCQKIEEKLAAELFKLTNQQPEHSTVEILNKAKPNNRIKLKDRNSQVPTLSKVNQKKHSDMKEINYHKTNPRLKLKSNYQTVKPTVELNVHYFDTKSTFLNDSTFRNSATVIKPQTEYDQENFTLKHYHENYKDCTLNYALLIDFTKEEKGTPKVIVKDKNMNSSSIFSKVYNKSTLLSTIQFKIPIDGRKKRLRIPIKTHNSKIILGLESCLVKGENGTPKLMLKPKALYSRRPLNICKSQSAKIDIPDLQKPEKHPRTKHSLWSNKTEWSLYNNKSNLALGLKQFAKGDCQSISTVEENLQQICVKELSYSNERKILKNCVELSKTCSTTDIAKHNSPECQTHSIYTSILTVTEEVSVESVQCFDGENVERDENYNTSRDSDLGESRFKSINTSSFCNELFEMSRSDLKVSEESYQCFDGEDIVCDENFSAMVEPRGGESEELSESRFGSINSSFCNEPYEMSQSDLKVSKESYQRFDGENVVCDENFSAIVAPRDSERDKLSESRFESINTSSVCNEPFEISRSDLEVSEESYQCFDGKNIVCDVNLSAMVAPRAGGSEELSVSHFEAGNTSLFSNFEKRSSDILKPVQNQWKLNEGEEGFCETHERRELKKTTKLTSFVYTDSIKLNQSIDLSLPFDQNDKIRDDFSTEDSGFSEVCMNKSLQQLYFNNEISPSDSEGSLKTKELEENGNIFSKIKIGERTLIMSKEYLTLRNFRCVENSERSSEEDKRTARIPFMKVVHLKAVDQLINDID